LSVIIEWSGFDVGRINEFTDADGRKISHLSLIRQDRIHQRHDDRIIATKDATRGFKKGIPAKDRKISIDQTQRS
jgi:hypothetical protein